MELCVDCRWHVPYVTNEALPHLDHLSSRRPLPLLPSSSSSSSSSSKEKWSDEFGEGTETNPLRVYRHRSVSLSTADPLRLICLSDTHNRIDRVRIPDGDFFIHCGDAVNFWSSARDLRRFNRFVGNLSHRHKLFVSGNHCISLDENRPDLSQLILSKMIYLQDQSIEIEGIRFYGSPWRPRRGCLYPSEAFGFDHRRIGEEIWSRIPSDTDVLLTHSPPFGVLDESSLHGARLGCLHLLREVVQRVRPRLHLFGHVHDAAGIALLRSETNRHLIDRSRPSASSHPHPHPQHTEEEERKDDEEFRIFFANLAIQRGRRTLGQPVVIDFFL